MLKSLINATVATLIAASALSASAQAAGDPAKGKMIFNRCKACHTLTAAERLKMGPSLAGVFGRKAGTSEGYKYSPAMAEADVVWGADTLDQYLADPKGFIPQNKMIFPGLKKEQDRADVIAYLEQATKE